MPAFTTLRDRVAVKKSIVGKALAGLKAAAKGVSGEKSHSDGSSEKIVQIPAVTVFSEVPFARVGTIGGTGVNVISSPGAVRSENDGNPRKSRTNKTAGKKTSPKPQPATKTRSGTKKPARPAPAKKFGRKAR
jgi:hypothetical protein